MGKTEITRVVGIDFGTSTSLIKVKRYQNGEPLGDRFFTKGVTFGNGEADTKAATIVRRNADGTVTCGRDADEPVEGAEIFKDFKMKLESENPVKKEQAEQLTESFLSYLYTWYVQQSSTLGAAEDVEQTIISYPVKWKDETRNFMKQAAIKAGFQNVTSMNEASAALYTVLSQQSGELGKKGILKSGQTGYLLLIDMGAGTTDLAFSRYHVAKKTMGILHAEDISNEIIVTWPVKGSRLACGGREIDKVLEKYVADYLKGMKSNGQSLSPEQAEQIASANSAAKKWKEETVSRDLNEGKTVTTCGYVAAFSMIFGGASFPGFDRFKFEQMISGHILDFRQLLEGGLQAAQREDEGLSENYLDFVILTGGHSNWYFAKDILDGTQEGLNHPLLNRVQSDKKRVICLPSPQETVSLGLVYSPLSLSLIIPELAHTSKLWYEGTCTAVAGKLKLRKICVFQGQAESTEIIDEGPYARLEHFSAMPPEYEYEYLDKVELDDSGWIFGYTNWGTVYEIRQYAYPEKNMGILSVYDIVNPQVTFKSKEDVIGVFTTQKNRLVILSKKIPGEIAALLGKGNDILIIRIYQRDSLGKFQRIAEGEKKIRFPVRDETIISYLVTSDCKGVYIISYNQIYYFGFTECKLKTPFGKESHMMHPRIKSVAMSKDGLSKLEMRTSSNNEEYICTFADTKKGSRYTVKKDSKSSYFTKGKVLLSDDGKIGVLVTEESLAQIWDLEHDIHLRDIHGSLFAVSSNGEMLISEENNSIHLWDIATGKFLKTLCHEKLTGIKNMDISKDGKTIIANSVNFVCSWNVS